MPRDPVTAKEYEHNEKVKNWSIPMLYYAMVARTVKRDEVMNNPKARQACDEEWQKLEKQTCWDTTKVISWREVSKEARESGKEVHIGSLHELCVEKGSELPDKNTRTESSKAE